MKKSCLIILLCFLELMLFSQNKNMIINDVDFNNSVDTRGLISKPSYIADYRSEIDSTFVRLSDGGVEFFFKDSVKNILIYGDNIVEPFYEQNDIPSGRYWFSLPIKSVFFITVIIDDKIFTLLKD